MKKISALLFVTLPLLAAGAAPHAVEVAPAPKVVEGCTLDSITDRCRIFDPKTDKIELKDGTFIPNLPKILAGKPHSDFEEYRILIEKDKALEKKKFALQRKIEQLLRKVPGASMHPDYKIYLRDPHKILELSTIVKDIDAEVPDTDTSILLWWPPNKPEPADTPDEKEVAVKDAREKIRRCFPTKRLREEYAKLVDDVTELIDAVAQTTAGAERRRKPGRFAERPGTADKAEIRENPTVKAMRKVTPERAKRVGELMDFSRKAMLETIRRGRADKDLSEDEQNMLKKIEAVHFVPEPSDSGIGATCVGTVPNAFYSQEEHSVTLCRNFYNLPDTEIVSTLGHELFHAIDPCNSQFDTYTIDKEEFDRLREPPKFYPIKEIREDNERFSAYSSILNGTASGKTAATFGLTTGSRAVDYFSNKKVLTRIAKGCKFEAYPFRGVYACLKRPERGGFRSESPAAFTRFAKEVAHARAKVHARDPAFDPEKDEADIVRSFAAHPECLDVDYKSQMCETMSDWAGAKVLGKFLADKKAMTPAEKLGAVSLFAMDACLKRAQKARGGVSKRPSAVIAAAHETRAEIQDEHPDPAKRVDDVILRDENVALALCGKAPTTKACEEETK